MTDFFFWFSQNKITMQNNLKPEVEDITYQKVLLKIMLSPTEKNFITKQLINIKWFKERRKLTNGQVEDYTIGCLLDYEWTKRNRYWSKGKSANRICCAIKKIFMV